jgi:hypothetical protein
VQGYLFAKPQKPESVVELLGAVLSVTKVQAA